MRRSCQDPKPPKSYSDPGFLFTAGKALLVAGLLAFIFANAVAADDAVTVRKIVDYLATEFHMTVEDIVRFLPALPGDSGMTSDRKLVRWPGPDLKISIVEIGDVHRNAEIFKKQMIDVIRLIGWDASFCEEQVTVGADDTYSPTIERQQCLSKPHDVVLVVYQDSARQMFHDLRLQSQDKDGQAFWAQREAGQNESPEIATCGEHLGVDEDRSWFQSGVAYLHVGARDDNRCVEALPYVMLGEPPIPMAGNRLVYSPEILMLLYSARLYPGISLGQAADALRE